MNIKSLKTGHFIKKGTEKISKNNDKTSNKMALDIYLSIITLNVNGLNAPIKRHKVSEWIKKKSKTHLYSAYNRFILDLKSSAD